jgi:hypothetical protein
MSGALSRTKSSGASTRTGAITTTTFVRGGASALATLSSAAANATGPPSPGTATSSNGRKWIPAGRRAARILLMPAWPTEASVGYGRNAHVATKLRTNFRSGLTPTQRLPCSIFSRRSGHRSFRWTRHECCIRPRTAPPVVQLDRAAATALNPDLWSEIHECDRASRRF